MHYVKRHSISHLQPKFPKMTKLFGEHILATLPNGTAVRPEGKVREIFRFPKK